VCLDWVRGCGGNATQAALAYTNLELEVALLTPGAWRYKAGRYKTRRYEVVQCMAVQARAVQAKVGSRQYRLTVRVR
jgi:hypothetical protein